MNFERMYYNLPLVVPSINFMPLNWIGILPSKKIRGNPSREA